MGKTATGKKKQVTINVTAINKPSDQAILNTATILKTLGATS
ncbi:hypothetical protein [Bacillus atrophaeus]|nr:hypothetical protein [Bacillus atrophaeus]MEC0803579.1 hypothetical protein [Bacillus atrophaeus]MEC0854226.1 hypothetical protein [Bacillus atrophaeus]MEC0857428.1 hypothetical protein [Bacillus atrophaeus]MEC0860885.1 hypothetical protein [Bacillus atrophaeus]MEC0869835.1 hypothetical protein [Bacillus atrophaeus]